MSRTSFADSVQLSSIWVELVEEYKSKKNSKEKQNLHSQQQEGQQILVNTDQATKVIHIACLPS